MSQRETTSRPLAGARELGLIGLFFAWMGAWFTTARAYYRAAIAYEELYRLSESELRQRGYRRPIPAVDRPTSRCRRRCRARC